MTYDSIQKWLNQTFNLTTDQATNQEIDRRFQSNINLVGSTAWILIFAILIASIGLNVNSTAVIIGAMLISPLMGPIQGIGYGAATYNVPLIRKAAANLLIAVIISLLTSTLYFKLTPLTEAHSELLARTSPTIWDVLIAFFGGMAGVIGLTRKETSNVIPGVAIATALMPPLCTAGYGFATQQWSFVAGAFYLFLINAVFITAATYIVCQLLRLPDHNPASAEIQKKLHYFFWSITLLTALPSLYLAYQLVQSEIYQQKAGNYVRHSMQLPDHYIAKTEIAPNQRQLTLTILGKPLTVDQTQALQEDINKSELAPSRLIIRQANTSNFDPELLKENQQALDLLQQQQNELNEFRAQDNSYIKPQIIDQLFEEIHTQIPEIKQMTLTQGYASSDKKINADPNTSHTHLNSDSPSQLLLVKTDAPLNISKQEQFTHWFTTRTGLHPEIIFNLSNETVNKKE